MTTIVGFDPGNSEATLIAGKNTCTIPSYIGSGSLDELRRIRGGAGRDGLENGEYVLESDGRSLFVGALALEQTRDATSARGDVSRYWNGHTRRLLLTLAAAALPRAETSIRVVTGLPVQVWSKETVKQVQQSLIGEHHFILNGRPRTLSVEGVMVLMEGAGALAVHGISKDVPQAVIDVGGRTTDLFWAQGQKPDISRCKGLSTGIEKAGDRVSAAVLLEYGRTLRRSEVRAQLRAHAAGTAAPPLFADGAPLHLNGHVTSAIDAVADEIATFVAQVWGEGERGKVAGEAARVLLIGGGAYYVAAQLQRLIARLDVPRHPELANAQGYLAVGQQIPEVAWAKLRGV